MGVACARGKWLMVVACGALLAWPGFGAAPADTKVPVPFAALEGYFSKMDRGARFFVVGSKPEFEISFGVAATMGQAIRSPDFERDVVVGWQEKPTDVATTLRILRIEKVGRKLVVSVRSVVGERLGWTMSPLCCVTVARADVDAVEFWGEQERALALVPLPPKESVRGAPKRPSKR